MKYSLSDKRQWLVLLSNCGVGSPPHIILYHDRRSAFSINLVQELA